MSDSTCIAVLDIGKTNKKVMIFDQSLKLIDSAYEGFEESVDGAVHIEDLSNMTTWLKEQLGRFAREHTIGAVSVTTHGATLICVDQDGTVKVPPVAYTTETDDSFHDRFYATCGAPKELQRTTATPAFNLLLNAGKTIQFVKEHYPKKFETVGSVVTMPAYFGYVLTGAFGSEPTYMGCHTYLLDFGSKQYSSVADSLGVRDKLPPMAENSWQVLGTVSEAVSKELGLPGDCIVTMGIHDSNSSLLPYLVKGYRNFVLNSTGTWCVEMHPTDTFELDESDLGKLVFYNLDAFFNPVRTTIFMGGQEFDTYDGILKKMHSTDSFPAFDVELCRKIVAEKQLFVLPSVVKGTGLFPDSPPRVVEGDKTYPLAGIESGAAVPEAFSSYETAYAALNLSLAVQTSVALEMAGFDGAGNVFTEGGFRKNTTYNPLLAALYPKATMALTGLEEATAFGAALLAKAALDKGTPMDTAGLFDIETIDVPRPDIPGIDEYAAEFRRRVSE